MTWSSTNTLSSSRGSTKKTYDVGSVTYWDQKAGKTMIETFLFGESDFPAINEKELDIKDQSEVIMEKSSVGGTDSNLGCLANCLWDAASRLG
ncbi:hypothetical protein TNCV_1902651 [Trichonephila clavipes]|nr:hypothetical protein TNCV_1902651 [Trichonephila clavipes]